MTEIIFVVEEAPEGGYTARALGEGIHTKRKPSASSTSRCGMPYVAISIPKRRRG